MTSGASNARLRLPTASARRSMAALVAGKLLPISSLAVVGVGSSTAPTASSTAVTPRSEVPQRDRLARLCLCKTL